MAVSKRQLFGSFGMAGAMILASQTVQAAPSNPDDPKPSTMVGALDLRDLEVFDSHMHPVFRTMIAKTYEGQTQEFAEVCTPEGVSAARQAQIVAQTQRLVLEAPRRTGYFNYVARTYGVPSTIEGFDSVVTQHIVSDEAFTAYIRTIFDREKIGKVLLQADEEMPTPPKTLIPADRHAWTSVVSELTKITWAKKNGFATVTAAADAMEARMAVASAADCKGFKNVSAYYRTLGLTKPSLADAQTAMDRLLRALDAPSKVVDVGADIDPERFTHDPELHAALFAYEDYMFRRAYANAGRLNRPIIIHSAVALHPALRTDFNDPRPLYDVFMDPDLLKAGTRFIVIHTGYPMHHVVASFISQMPHVFTDVSFFSKYPSTLKEVYTALLGLGPSYKVMFGSDSNSVPEEIGYCADNGRVALAQVLNTFRTDYGWSPKQVESIARGVLAENAKTFFKI